jgi:hypothetical protein
LLGEYSTLRGGPGREKERDYRRLPREPDIQSNGKCFFISHAMVCLFYGIMRAEQPAGPKAATWNATARPVAAPALARHVSRVRREEQHAKNTRVAIVLSLFLVLLAAALLVGGRAIIDPMLKAAADRREAHRMGDIVFTMPDGAFCRHLRFDNKTAELSEGTIQRCGYDRTAEPASDKKGFGFVWNTH